MQSTCPNCGKHDKLSLRSGGALVCRACFVTETLLGSWLALPELRGPSADLPTCPECAEVVHDADCRLVGDGRPVDGGALVCRECAEKHR